MKTGKKEIKWTLYADNILNSYLDKKCDGIYKNS